MRIRSVTQGERRVPQVLEVQGVHRDELIGDDIGVIVEHEGAVQSRGINGKNPGREHDEGHKQKNQTADFDEHTPIIR